MANTIACAIACIYGLFLVGVLIALLADSIKYDQKAKRYREKFLKEVNQRFIEDAISSSEANTTAELEFWIAHYFSIYNSCGEIMNSPDATESEFEQALREAFYCAQVLGNIYPIWESIYV